MPFVPRAVSPVEAATGAPQRRSRRAIVIALGAMALLAALYALCALLCFVTFAAVYYPKMYAPLLLEKTRSKFIEWHVTEHAQTAQACDIRTARWSRSAKWQRQCC